MSIKFNEKELEIVEISKAFRNANVPQFSYPMSMKTEWKEIELDD